MGIKSCRGKNIGRTPIIYNSGKSLEGGKVAGKQTRSELLIGCLKKQGRIAGDSEDAQRFQRLGAAHLSPARTICGLDTPFAIHYALRPWIVLAVGDVDNASCGPRTNRALQCNPTRKRFVVRMRRYDKNARGVIKPWKSHDDAWSINAKPERHASNKECFSNQVTLC
jgi:hypothetical protein